MKQALQKILETLREIEGHSELDNEDLDFAKAQVEGLLLSLEDKEQ